MNFHLMENDELNVMTCHYTVLGGLVPWSSEQPVCQEVEVSAIRQMFRVRLTLLLFSSCMRLPNFGCMQ